MGAAPEGPTLSVCIVTRGGGAGLLAALAALPAAAGELSWEAVVVDNASPDDTVAQLRAAHPELRLIENERNLGFARGCNQAAAAARGELLCFLNDDACPTPGSLAGLAAALTPGVLAVGPLLVDPAGAPEQSAGPLPRLGGLLHRIRLLRASGLFRRAYRAWRRAPLPATRSPVGRLGGAALLVRRADASWDEGYPFGLEDVDLCARLGARGELLYCPELRVVHIGGRASAKDPSFVLESFERGYARYLSRHDPRPWAAPLYKLLVTLDAPWRLLAALWRARRGAPERARLGAELRFYLGGGLLRFWAS